MKKKENNSQSTVEDKISLEKKYEILIRARNFHYENFNKWMAYFYVMIGSIILGFSYIISKDPTYADHYDSELTILGFAGFTISLFWHWANKGYYYWNINFITLINHYEKNLLKFEESERIYFVFANKGIQNNYLNPFSGANISTSKISIILSYLFALFFGSYVIIRLLKRCILCYKVLISTGVGAAIITIAILSFTFAKSWLSSYHNHFPDLAIDSSKSSTYKDTNNFTT
ncbi:MAG: hypothetical protein ACLGH8_03330 [Bacteroidia bacterium]